MSPLYLWNRKLLVVDGALATSPACCCGSSSSSSSSYGDEAGCPDCYKLEYEWVINDCNGAPKTISGTLLMNSGGIVCYNDPDAILVTPVDIDYGNLCGQAETTYWQIYCSTSNTIIIGSTQTSYLFGFLESNLCCSDSGYFNIEADDGGSTMSITMSLANNGECDCAGYTGIGP